MATCWAAVDNVIQIWMQSYDEVMTIFGFRYTMKMLWCDVFGHKALKRTVDVDGIPYPGYCERCRCFVRDEIYKEQNRLFNESLKAKMTSDEAKRFTEECERYGF